ncbi:hypothetical protein DFH09DRAFT_1136247 [Mycena vulgaris]|nr:hypothetical protein DFH09DRAFT_1229843 [Mycena vulgaris]KAJ6595130.1 hypothetical protein DFH09DRAFT_1136247 [Mycena vulgaris]
MTFLLAFPTFIRLGRLHSTKLSGHHLHWSGPLYMPCAPRGGSSSMVNRPTGCALRLPGHPSPKIWSWSGHCCSERLGRLSSGLVPLRSISYPYATYWP